jgi:ParB-like chromosome segregation protein Spo0J
MIETKLYKISDIKPNPNNPRIIKDSNFLKLVNSIKEFPEMLKIRPIVINEDNIVLGGNMRLKACKEAKLKEIPVIMASDLTEAQQREFIIKDNIGFGEWDFQDLAQNWNADELETWGLDLPELEQDEKGTIVKENINPFIKTHILLSFPPEKMIDIQEYIEKICLIENVEYEQSSN